MEYLAVVNLKRYQHYDKRRPPWVKVYRDIFTDYGLMACADTTKWLAVSLILLASEDESGLVPFDTDWISSRAHIKKRSVKPAVRDLLRVGFIDAEPDSDLLAECEQDATPTRARTRSLSASFNQKEQEEFDRFWKHYPNKVAKIEAQKAWSQMNGERPPIDELVAKVDELAVSKRWLEEKGRYIPHPATWLRRGGWDDEVRE